MTEEELKRTIQENLKIETVEMMRENAAVLFEHRGLEPMADEIRKGSSTIIELVRIEEFYGVCPKPHLSGTRQVGSIKLFWKREGELIKIEGIARETSKDLKQFFKNFAAFTSHEELGKEADLFFVEKNCCFWAPKGELIREILVQWWKSSLRGLGFSIFSSSGASITADPRFEYGCQLAEISEKKRDEELSMEGGLYDLPWATSDRFWWALDEKSALANVNSCLHFIKKTVNMMAIDCSWIFYNNLLKSRRCQKNRDLSIEILSQSLEISGIETFRQNESFQKYSAIEARFTDSLGREWSGPRIELRDASGFQIDQSMDSFVLVGSVFRSLESLIALLLESSKGELPFWLAPEQVRILPVKQEDVAWAVEIAEELIENGYRVHCDADPGSLSEKVSVANQYKVPYIVVVGKREREEQAVSVRCSSKGNKASVVSFELFMEELKKQREKAQFPIN